MRISRIFLSILLLAGTLALVQQATALKANPSTAPDALPAALQQAIDARDSSRAMPYLDLESIVHNALNETLPQINQSVREGKLLLSPPLAAALAGFNSGNAVTKRTAGIFITSELEKFLIYGVDTGSFAGNPLPKDDRMVMDGGIFSRFGDISLERKEFSDSRLLKYDGQNSVITCKLYDYGVRQAYPLTLRMKLQDGAWQVVAIDNAATLFKQLVSQH